MIKFIDPDHPFYRPLWIRLLIIVFCAVWTAVEFYGGQVMWGTIFRARPFSSFTGRRRRARAKAKPPATRPTARTDAYPVTVGFSIRLKASSMSMLASFMRKVALSRASTGSLSG
jgi:hypothetical protein